MVSRPRAKVQLIEMDNELARIERLKGVENWGTWKFQVKILVQTADALEIVNGSVERPIPPTETGSAELLAEYRKNLKAWNILDSKAQKIIATTVSEQPLLHIMNCQSSKEMWDKLHEVFESKNETAKHILQQQWYVLERKTTDDMATHIAKVKDLAHRLRMLDEPVSDSMIMTKILMTLPSSYQHFNTGNQRVRTKGPCQTSQRDSPWRNCGTSK